MRFLIHCIRRLRHDRLYSTISVAGLAIGMACALCVLLYVIHETSFDVFLDNHDRIYRLIRETRDDKGRDYQESHPGGLAAAMEESIPEVEHAIRFWGSRGRINYKDRNGYVWGLMVGGEFFEVFSFELLRGDPETALADQNRIVLTEETAQRFFGDEDPMGKTVEINHVDTGGDYIVTGIMKDPPTTRSVYFQYVHTFPAGGWIDFGWSGWSPGDFRFKTMIYTRLATGSDPANVERSITSLASSHLDREDTKTLFHLQPITESHLYSTGDYGLGAWGSIEQLRRIAAMGLFILMIACLNFINISTARSLTRTTEVGIRKVVGASRKDLFWQFVGESFFSALLALCAGIVFCHLVLPTFNEFVNRSLDLSLFVSAFGIGCIIGFALIVSLAVGIPPGLVLSSFDPVAVIKGSTRVRTRSWLRQGLVGLQFALSILLVLITVVMSDQMDFIRNKKLGYDSEQIVTTPIYQVEWRLSQAPEHERLSWDSGRVERAFLAHPSVVSAASFRFSMGMSKNRGGGPLWRTIRGPDGRQIQMPMQEVEDDFLETFGIQLLLGRNFNPDIETDFREAILLNEDAVKAFDLEDPLGTQLSQLLGDGSYAPRMVIGVVKNFHLLSLHEPIQPFALYTSRGTFRTLALRITTDDIPATLSFMEETWERYLPGQPFEYRFLDDWLQFAYSREARLAQTFNASALVALLIAAIGLYGLAAFSVDRRMKEIGVRKVLGASSSSVVGMITRDLSRPVLFANLLAWPIGYAALRTWLDGFAYRMDLSLAPFILAGAAGLLVALITVGLHAWRGAQADPVDTLRYE